MANFAEIDENNVVIRVVRTPDSKPNEGYDWLVERLGGTWVKTSYNTLAGEHAAGGTPLRKNYAGVGMTYDAERDAFIPRNNFASWILDEATCTWMPPVAKPDDGKLYNWDEETTSWVEVITPADS